MDVLINKMLNIFIYIIFLELVRCAGILYQSPCPDIFQYSFDQNQEIIGIITISSPDNNNIIELSVELSVGNRIQVRNLAHIKHFEKHFFCVPAIFMLIFINS